MVLTELKEGITTEIRCTKESEVFNIISSKKSELLKMAEYVLQKNQKNYTKSPIQTKDLVKYVGRGLLTAEGDHWKKQRKCNH